uniref:C-type lectin domain-containing protein n=1 Tax=Panagrolaimus superbus TaxID=310955 RepID=A0A914YK85_9BILA
MAQKLIFLLFFLTSIKAAETSILCPDESYEWQRSCYFFENKSTGFADAESFCASMEGHLVAIHDGFTNTLISQKAQNFFHESTVTDFWIGLTDLMILGNWTWMDGTYLNYTNWASNEPQNITGNFCAVVTLSNGLWKADDCFKQNPFVCRVEPTTTSTTTTTTTTQYPIYANCTRPFTYFEPTHSCYGYGNWTRKGMNWAESERYCQRFGGHLTSIHSYEEMQFIAAFGIAMYTNIWIGGYSNDGGNTWKWSDNTPWENKFWYPGYPKLNTSACLQVSDLIIDHLCTDEYRMICKIPLHL